MKAGTKIWIQLLGVGGGIAMLLILLQLLRYSYLLRDWSIELYLLLAGIPLLAAGILAGRWLSAHGRGERQRITAPACPLTPRELEILEQVSAGLSNQEVADRLFVSVSTVKTHLQSIYAKLEVKRRTQAVASARRLKLIS